MYFLATYTDEQKRHDVFTVLMGRHIDRFYRLATRLLRDAHEAEDVIQDNFIKLWNRPTLYQNGTGAKFTTWFYRVISNACMDKNRKTQMVDGENIVDMTADTRPQSDEQLIETQQSQALRQAIDNLPARQKEALILCFYEGASNQEAAAMMDIGVKALESLLMRAKANLKQNLQDWIDDA